MNELEFKYFEVGVRLEQANAVRKDLTSDRAYVLRQFTNSVTKLSQICPSYEVLLLSATDQVQQALNNDPLEEVEGNCLITQAKQKIAASLTAFNGDAFNRAHLSLLFGQSVTRLFNMDEFNVMLSHNLENSSTAESQELTTCRYCIDALNIDTNKIFIANENAVAINIYYDDKRFPPWQVIDSAIISWNTHQSQSRASWTRAKVIVQIANNRIMVDETWISLSLNTMARILHMIVANNGVPISSPTMRQQDDSLPDDIPRVIKRLPPQVRRIIESSTGKGFWLAEKYRS